MERLEEKKLTDNRLMADCVSCSEDIVRVLYRIYRVCGELCYLSGAVIKNKTVVKPEPQTLVSFCRPEETLPAYKERWTIEDTHMVHIYRIEQLFGVVIIAYI